jgi:hypothetical protein
MTSPDTMAQTNVAVFFAGDTFSHTASASFCTVGKLQGTAVSVSNDISVSKQLWV